jgi:UDP-N-acetylmuramoyl-L-alanyl-D-glutamate--2,6-diaminopimelate ligase
VEQHIEYVVMEASSHAVAFGRLYGLEFEVIGFTNLGQDHLDYHHTMEEYFATKMLLFEQLKPEGRAFFNTDNPWGARAFDGCSVPKQALTFSMVKNDLLGLAVQINQQTFECPALFGAFNGENSALAITIAQSLGVSIESIKKAMLLFPGVPGRVQKHRLKNGATAFVDYAHNPSSFEAILSTLRPFTTHLIVVFGCGGNRDNTKRPLMGSITEKYADLIVLTDDNPRFEDRREIIKDVLTGIDDQLKVICEPDRANAIKIAAEKSNSNSIIALLGKGHENYYLVNGESYEFDDYKEITAF